MNEKELTQEIEEIKKSSGIIVNSPETFKAVSDNIIAAKAMSKKITAYWKEMKDAAYSSWKKICGSESAMLDPLKDYISDETKKITIYLTEQEKIRREAQRKMDEERRIAEQKERDRIAKAEEKARLEAEELRKQQSNDAKIQKKIERLEEKAETLSAKKEAVFIPPAIVKSEIDKTTKIGSGSVTQKEELTIEIYDRLAVISAIVKGELPDDLITINEYRLKKTIEARGLKEFPGIKIDFKIGTQIRG